VLKAIVLQLVQKAMSGNTRAWRLFFQYREFANSGAGKSLDIVFADSGYTQALAKSFPGGDIGQS
jgi:hypothetical protein